MERRQRVQTVARTWTPSTGRWATWTLGIHLAGVCRLEWLTLRPMRPILPQMLQTGITVF